MVESTVVMAAALSVLVLTFSLTGLYFWRLRRRRRWRLGETKHSVETLPSVEISEPSFSKISKPQNQNQVLELLAEIKRRGVSSNSKPTLFSWDDHPSLVNDAVENGWSQFAFTDYVSSLPSSSRSRLLGLCTVGEIEKETETPPEISWEVSQESADFMQKIRLNSGLKKKINDITSNSSPVYSVIRTALPLPGPPLASFPQEAYFEITILQIAGDENEKPTGSTTAKEGERTKLIQETVISKASSESLAYFTSNNKVSNFEESKLNRGEEEEENKDGDEKVEDIILSIGLTSGSAGSAPAKLPGSYHGSIGFNSNGSVYLDGMKLVFESENGDWGREDKVIGCGFNAKEKKVFFTVDSELVHIINCKSEEFGSPVYPVLTGKEDITVVVNLGQCVFKYKGAQRTPNPCFVSTLMNVDCGGGSNGNGYEDSRELFSMGMIDSQWFNRQTPKTAMASHVVFQHTETTDDESSNEIELFEIVVEDSDSD